MQPQAQPEVRPATEDDLAALTGVLSRAFSNDPPTPTALPPFKAVRFKAGDGETKIKVKLRYLK